MVYYRESHSLYINEAKQWHTEQQYYWTNCILWQFFLIFPACIDNFYVYGVILWSHTGRRECV